MGDELIHASCEVLDRDDHPAEHVHRVALVGVIVLQLLDCRMEDVVDFI